MRPDFRITADGEDFTAKIRDRLISLTLQDEAGVEADQLSLEIDDRGYRVALPEKGALLRVALGFRETGLTDMGAFTVDQLSGSGPVAKMTITAKGADMAEAMRAPKTRSWTDTTLGEIARTIASDHGLSPAIAADLASAAYAHVAQSAESDLNLLTRLTRGLDAIAKPASGRLVIVRRGSGEMADGSPAPKIDLPTRLLSSWSWDIDERQRYGKATATWWDRSTGTPTPVSVGDDTPELVLRHRYPTKDEARRAAEAAVNGSGRVTGTISAQLSTFRPGLMAGAIAVFPDIRPELRGEWVVSSVTHNLAGTLTSSVSAERDNDKAAS